MTRGKGEGSIYKRGDGQTGDAWFGGAARIHGDTLRVIAAVYADHPDYRPEWAA